MKTNNSMKGTSGASATTSQIYSAYFPQFASYFVKFIQAYNAVGLPVYAISPLNEPGNSQSGYPSAILTATDEASFIANNLGPALAAANLGNVKIFGLEENWSDTTFAQTLLQSAAAPYLAGNSFHSYNGTVSQMSTVQAMDTTKGVWFTEFTGTVTCTSTCPTLTASTFSASGFQYQMQTYIMGIPQNHGRSIVGWSLALNQNEGPQNGGCTDCAGIVTIDTSKSPAAVYLNGAYYALGQIGKLVVPGASVIQTTPGTTTGIQSIGFQNPDGSLVVVAYNGGSSQTTLTLTWNSQTADFALPANSAAIFKWTP
jgi:glucosylceramidase